MITGHIAVDKIKKEPEATTSGKRKGPEIVKIVNKKAATAESFVKMKNAGGQSSTVGSTKTKPKEKAPTAVATTTTMTTKKEGSTNKEVNRRKRFAQFLKEKNMIRISIHRSGIFSNAEMSAIIRHLRVRKIQEVDTNQNLIIGWADIGNIKHLKDIPDSECEEIKINDEYVSEIEHACQANGTDIDRDVNIVRMALAPALIRIPPMIEHPEPVIKDPRMPKSIYFNEKAFKNYSATQVPENVAVLLSMGPKFCAPIYYKKKDFEKLKSAADFINETFSKVHDKETIRENIRKHIMEYEEDQFVKHTSEIRDFFDRTLEEAKQFCKNHPELIVTQADKAKCSIIMNRETYNNKVENLLRDTSTYAVIETTSTPAYMKMNQNILERMEKAEMISKKEADSAKTGEGRISNMYGLIKTHKEGQPIRPIVNTRGSMGYAAANIVTGILTKAREVGKYNVVNSAQAIEKIRDAKLNPDEHFYSYDVISMFTNIPVSRAIDAVKRRQKQLDVDNQKMKIIIDVILLVCHKSTEITFNGKIYKQIKGMKMGSSLSPILSDFVMEDMLDHVFATIERPIMVIKYVDDILSASNEEDAKKLFERLNEMDEHIKFEMEEEKDNSINYLDIKILNKPFDLTTKWYQKLISSGRFLNYLSHHPSSVIINTAIAFVQTMINNTSMEYYNEIIITAKKLLTINSYPENISNIIINKAQEKIHEKEKEKDNASQLASQSTSKTYGLSIPFIPRLSQKIRSELETQSDRITPLKPIHKNSSEIFDPSKKLSSTPRPSSQVQKIVVEDYADLTQE